MKDSIHVGQTYRHKFINDAINVAPDLPNCFQVLEVKDATIGVAQLGAGLQLTHWGRSTFEENFELVEQPLNRGLADPE